MPWKEASVMSQRQEFIILAQQGGVPFSELCRRFSIHRDTGYKWLHRFETEGQTGLENRSRRPYHSPCKTKDIIESKVLSVREQHQDWGGRKICRYLQDRGHQGVPSASTITEILRRHQKLNPEQTSEPRDWQRFEAPAPNCLWQMDFKGHFALASGRCHPLTLLDDHSRYALTVTACANEDGPTVQSILTHRFRQYGLPRTMLMDNGGPWGKKSEHTSLSLWLLRLNVKVIHGRAKHPQTQGKLERFHRSLKSGVTRYCQQLSLAECQERLERWRLEYNTLRPHEALGMAVPAKYYEPSKVSFPETLPVVEYGPEDIVRKVQSNGWFSYRNHYHRVSQALRGEPIALRPTVQDGVMDIYYCHQKIGQLDLHEHN
jgi:transposase InsO family protein